MAITVLEVAQGLCIPAREVAINKPDIAIAAVLFTEQVQSPIGNILGSKRLLHGGELPERRYVRGIFALGPVKHAGFDQVADFFDDFQAAFLRIHRRNKSLEREETAERRIVFHMQAHHERIVKLVELRGVASHDRSRGGCGAVVYARHARIDSVLLLLFGRYAAEVTQVVFEIHILGKPERYRTQREAGECRILEEAEDLRLVPGLGKQRIVRSLGNTAQALDKHREEKHGSEHTEQHTHRCHHAEFVESAEVGRQQREEGGDSREARQNEGLEHLLLRMFQNFFESRILVQELLRSSQDMDGIVDTDTQDNRCNKDRERVQLAVEEGRKRERRDTGVKHRGSNKDGALYAPEEDNREEEDKDKAYAEREDGIVRHVVHFLEAFVGSLDGEAGGNRVSLCAEIG